MGRTACTEPQCLYKGAFYLYLTVELYLYSPYGPYGLYRASVPVQGCTLPLPYSRAIPLLPLWAARPVQSLSACTRVTFTLHLFLHSFSSSIPYVRPIATQLATWRPINEIRRDTEINHGSRKGVVIRFGVLGLRLRTSTPPMGSTACTEPQCLYKGDLYLTFFLHSFSSSMPHVRPIATQLATWRPINEIRRDKEINHGSRKGVVIRFGVLGLPITIFHHKGCLLSNSVLWTL